MSGDKTQTARKTEKEMKKRDEQKVQEKTGKQSAQKAQVKTFTEGQILLPLVRFALPVLAALFLQAMYGAVDLMIVGIGAMASTALEVADKMFAEGRSVRVVDPRWALPVSDDLVELARGASSVAVLEDSVVGGMSGQVQRALAAAGLTVPVHSYGIPAEFLESFRPNVAETD